MNNLILINKEKRNSLSSDYVPSDLVITDNNENNFHEFVNPILKPTIKKEVYEHFLLLQSDARKLGFEIIIDSGYRSYQYQKEVWEDYFKKNIKDVSNKHPGIDDMRLFLIAEYLTDSFVAAPGHSEHQTGLAFDFAIYKNGIFTSNIKNTIESMWMLENAYKYGFILRYPKGKESITGYNYEEWHYRYVGNPYSEEMYDDNLTLEEYHKLVLKK